MQTFLLFIRAQSLRKMPHFACKSADGAIRLRIFHLNKIQNNGYIFSV